MSTLKNKVVAIISQDITETDRKRAFENEVMFSDETAQPITAGVLSDWFVCKLRHYIKIQRLQRLTGFKLNDRVAVHLKVNNSEQAISMKLSLNVERLEKILRDTPELVAEVFTPSPTIAGLISGKQSALAYVNGEARKVVLAERAESKPKATRKKKELPANNALENNPMLNLPSADNGEVHANEGVEAVFADRD